MSPAFTAWWERYRRGRVFPDRGARTHARLAAMEAFHAGRSYQNALAGKPKCEHFFTRNGSACTKCGALG